MSARSSQKTGPLQTRQILTPLGPTIARDPCAPSRRTAVFQRSTWSRHQQAVRSTLPCLFPTCTSTEHKTEQLCPSRLHHQLSARTNDVTPPCLVSGKFQNSSNFNSTPPVPRTLQDPPELFLSLSPPPQYPRRNLAELLPHCIMSSSCQAPLRSSRRRKFGGEEDVWPKG